MKKNKIVLFLALAMLGASVVPVYYWHKHSNDRFPSSVVEEDSDETKYATPINYLENQDMFERDPSLDEEKEDAKSVKAHLDFLTNHKEKLAESEEEESVQAHLDFLKDPQAQIAETEQVLCSTQEESLEDKIEKLIADKEELLKEIALLKKKDDKESKKSSPNKVHDKAIAHEDKKDSPVDSTTALMMAQLSQAMTSQQMLMQSQMQLMMMMQQQQSPESMYSKFAFDYYAFDAKERMYQRMAQSYYNYGFGSNLGGGIGIGYGAQANQGMFSVSGQDVKPIPVNPMVNYPYVVQPTAYTGSYPMYSNDSYGYMPSQHSSSFDFSDSSMTNKLERFEF